MARPLLIDLFCGAGGASMGYYRAGFDVLGVDHEPQKRYPFDFIEGDVFQLWDSLPHERAAAYAASPPCQAYSVTRYIRGGADHPDHVAGTRDLLWRTGKPYAIENVPGAPLKNPIVLCGTMFPGLRVYRHRLFECRPAVWFPPAACCHWGRPMPSAINGAFHTLDNQDFITVAGNRYRASDGRRAMGIDWMTRAELSQAIPPAYTEFIGRHLMRAVREDEHRA